MAHSQELVAAVRASYVYNALSLEGCASKHSVHKATASSWKHKAKASGDDWDKARTAARLADGGLGQVTSQLLENFTLLFKTTIDDISEGNYSGLEKSEAISRLSDAYAKTMKAASVGNPKIAKLSIALEVIKELTNIIQTKHPEALPVFLPILDDLEISINRRF